MMDALIYAGAAAFLAALAALALYHACWVRPHLALAQRALREHDDLLGAGTFAGTSRLDGLEAANAALLQRAERAEAALLELQAQSRTDVSRIGFTRYDAFDDSSSELSYALALLNREGDGVVLSSLYSRNETRTYGKPVQRWEPLKAASAEELQAIANARGG